MREGLRKARRIPPTGNDPDSQPEPFTRSGGPGGCGMRGSTAGWSGCTGRGPPEGRLGRGSRGRKALAPCDGAGRHDPGRTDRIMPGTCGTEPPDRIRSPRLPDSMRAAFETSSAFSPESDREAFKPGTGAWQPIRRTADGIVPCGRRVVPADGRAGSLRWFRRTANPVWSDCAVRPLRRGPGHAPMVTVRSSRDGSDR